MKYQKIKKNHTFLKLNIWQLKSYEINKIDGVKKLQKKKISKVQFGMY